MSVHMMIELRDREGAQTVMQALEGYKVRLRASIARTRRRLAEFESCYGVDTAHYDNAAHRPALPYPAHKHTQSGDAETSPVPTLSEILDHILRQTHS